MEKYEEILKYWFEELEPMQHFIQDDKVDEEIYKRFGKLHEAAAKGELYTWRNSLRGRLAEIIILDQFSRNLYRGKAKAFMQDNMALALAQECVAHHDLSELSTEERSFLYMPFMHSESLKIHEVAIELFNSEPGLAESLKHEIEHKETIETFGRYPYRNKALGRKNTPAEIEYLEKNNYPL